MPACASAPKDGMSHIPEDRHKHGLVLDYTLEENLVLQRYWEPEFQHGGFIRFGPIRQYAERLIGQYDIRSGRVPLPRCVPCRAATSRRPSSPVRSTRTRSSWVVQPTRGLDVGAIEYIHRQIVAERDQGKAVLLVSLELDEVMNLSDRILVMYEGEIVGEFDPEADQRGGAADGGWRRSRSCEDKTRKNSFRRTGERAPGRLCCVS